MATPEQNTLLAQSLFDRPASQYADQSNSRLQMLLKIAQATREEQLRRDIAAQQEAGANNRLRFQANNETAREKAAADRQQTAITEAQRHEDATLKARENADILRGFDTLYPQYAVAAQQAGVPVKARDEYDSSAAGLGQLSADLAQAKVGYDQTQKKASAKALLLQRDDAQNQADALKTKLGELSKPSPEDEKMARANAVNAVKQQIEQGGVESAKKLSKDAISKGLAALAKGSDAIATQLLGDEAKGLFDQEYEKTLFQLPNSKARMQEHNLLQQQYLAAQRNVSVIDTDLRKAAAVNPYLADELGKIPTPLQQLMSAPRARSFDAITPPPPASAGAVPSPTANTGLNLSKLLGMAAVSNPVTALPTAITVGAGYGLSKLFGGGSAAPSPSGPPDFSGDYTNPGAVPAVSAPSASGSSPLTQLLTGQSNDRNALISQYQTPEYLAKLAASAPAAAQPIDVDAVLAARPAGPWSPEELHAIQVRSAAQPQGQGIFQRLFPGAR